MRFLITTAFSATFLVATNATAATFFDFAYTYDGTTITQDVGSDTAAGTSLTVGDMFTSTVAAAGDDFFQVDADFNLRVPMSYQVGEVNLRLVDIRTAFVLDGLIVLSTREIGVNQARHVGAQLFDLTAGLRFDTVVFDWTFHSIKSAGDTIISDNPEFFASFSSDDRPFYNSDSVSYQSGASVVPLPAGLPLLLAGLAGFGVLARRKR